MNSGENMLNDDPLWFKEAIFYELRIGAFLDSTGNGFGDFAGLTQKLDYLRDLGVTVLWLLPFYPSPFKDDGYDISDYLSIHPPYGDLQDFRTFLKEAHERGLRVVTELVLNHTSDQHPWFQRARRSPAGSSHRDYYVWSDSDDRYKDARIIFKDFETSNWQWDPIAKAYYWHRFYSHQPDLNYDNPDVRKSILKVIDFWLDMGVDGLRLDAVPYLIERDKTNCENLAETHDVLRELRKHVDKKYKNRMLLAEANQWPEDAVAYFGKGDECHMAFHFPIMPRLFMASHMEDRFPLIDIIEQTPAIPESCQWAIFLRNHDELTLEMVTDEEREYMYRIYANDPRARVNSGIRRRLAPLLGNNRKRVELMNGLLLSLPGTPVLYYGDEIGMGDNIYLGDRNGVRTPMQWSPDRNAGFSRANPQKLYLPVITDPEYHFEAVNVEAQQGNLHSLLWWMKRIIALRKRFKAFGRGTVEFLKPDNRKVLAFVRRYQDECILVVANLSRYAQYVELDLSAFKGMRPVELFGQVSFPPVGDQPYLLTLGPHIFFWFILESQPTETIPTAVSSIPVLTVPESWEDLINGNSVRMLENALPGFLKDKRWFGGKSRKLRRAVIQENIPVAVNGRRSYLLFIQVEYVDGGPEVYSLPIGFAEGEKATEIKSQYADSIIASIKTGGGEGFLYDAIADKDFCSELFQTTIRRRQLKGGQGDVSIRSSGSLKHLSKSLPVPLTVVNMKMDQSNSSIFFGDKFILKLYRRLHPGVNPDVEIGLHLTKDEHFQNAPPIRASLEYRQATSESVTLGVLQDFVPNQGTAWVFTLDHIEKFIEYRLAEGAAFQDLIALPMNPLCQSSTEEIPAIINERFGPFLESFKLMGKRTGEMHLALADAQEDPQFIEETFTPHYQRSLYQSMRNLTNEVFLSLKKRAKELPVDMKPMIDQTMGSESKILSFFQNLLKIKITATRIRVHGDYHLGQLLYTGKDFIVIDFEGEPARPLGERRLKRSPLRDVAGMIRSFHYAAYSALANQVSRGIVSAEKRPVAEKAIQVWTHWVGVTFLKSYLSTIRDAAFIPKTTEERQTLLNIYLLEKAIYELGYELNNRPDLVKVPLEGINQFMAKQNTPAQTSGA